MAADSVFRATIRLRGVSKSFRAGAGSCTARVAALSDASVEIRGGEVLIVCGSAGSGKTTLLLCAAGLLHYDGEIARGLRHVVYRDLARREASLDGWPGRSAILLDSCDDVGILLHPRVAHAVSMAVDARSAVVLAGRDPVRCLAFAPPSATISIVHLRRGRVDATQSEIVGVHRVAEATSVGY